MCTNVSLMAVISPIAVFRQATVMMIANRTAPKMPKYSFEICAKAMPPLSLISKTPRLVAPK